MIALLLMDNSWTNSHTPACTVMVEEYYDHIIVNENRQPQTAPYHFHMHTSQYSSYFLAMSYYVCHACHHSNKNSIHNFAKIHTILTGSLSILEINISTSSFSSSIALRTFKNPLSVLLCSQRMHVTPLETASRISWCDISPTGIKKQIATISLHADVSQNKVPYAS